MRVLIHEPTLADMAEFLVAARRSRSVHRPWVAAPLTPAQFKAYLRHMQPPANVAFLVCRRRDRALAGVVNVSNIVRGLFQSVYLGYYVFAGFER